MPNLVRDIEERWMAINLRRHWVKVVGLLIRVARGDCIRWHHPDAHALLPPRVHVSRQRDGMSRVARVQATEMLVIEPLFAANKHLEKRPT